MSKNTIDLRQKKYFKLSSQIAQLDNTQLCSLFETSESNNSSASWGINNTIVLGQSKVFVKRVPITDTEYSHMFSTKNLYDLPTYCSYGFGSTGFGVFRELVTYIKTTNWVLEESIATFPLLYHYRIIPYFGQRMDVDRNRLQEYVEYWGNSENAGNYVLDRANANYELVLFLEYIPYVLEAWLRKNPDKLRKPLDDLRTTIAFLRAKEIIHFDAHFRNVLTDGNQIYLTDFGLALDKSFTLSQKEKIFFEQNTFYDYGEILRNLGHLIWWSYEACSESDKRRIIKEYGIRESLKPYELRAILLDNIEQIQSDGLMTLDDFYVASIVKYRHIITLMQDFFSDMWKNKKKDSKLPHVQLQQLLKATGFPPSADCLL